MKPTDERRNGYGLTSYGHMASDLHYRPPAAEELARFTRVELPNHEVTETPVIGRVKNGQKRVERP